MLNKQIYGFKKSKAFGLCSVVVASYLLFSGVASADELVGNQEGSNQPVVTETSNDQVVQTPTAADVSKAQGELNQANNELTAAQSNVEEKQQAFNVATVEKDKRVEEVNQAQELADKATPEEIEKAKDKVSKNESSIKLNEQDVKDKGNKVEEASNSLSEQEKLVSEAQSAVEKANKEKNMAQADVNIAQKALDETGAEEVFAKAEKAQAQQSKDQITVKNSESKLEKAIEADRVREEAIIAAKKDVDAKETALVLAGTTLKTTTERAIEASKKFENATNEYNIAKADFDAINTITLSPEYIQNMRDAYNDSDYSEEGIKKRLEADEKLLALGSKLREIPGNQYKSNTNDKKISIDIQNLSDEQKTELTLFAADLINQIRQQMGTTPVVVTPSSVAMGWDQAAYYQKKFTSMWEMKHDTRFIAHKYNNGHFIDEDLAGSSSDVTTMDGAKEAIYQAIIDWIFASDESLHASSITGNRNNTEAEKNYMGIGIANYTSDDSIVNFNNIGKFKDYDMANGFNTQEIVNKKSAEALTARYYQTQSNLNVATIANNQAQSALSLANKEKVNAEQALTNARTVLSDKQLVKVQTPDAQDALNQARNDLIRSTAENEKAQQAVNALNAEIFAKKEKLAYTKKILSQKELTLSEKESVLKSALGKMEQLARDLEDAKTNFKKAQANLTLSKDELVKAKANVELLQSAPQKLEEAKARFTSAENDYNNAEKALKSALKELSLAKEKQVNLQANFEKVSKAYNDYIKAKEEAERQARLKKEYEALTRKNTQKASVSNASTKVTAYKSSEAYSMLDIKHNIVEKTSYNSEGLVKGINNTTLPETGETSALNGTTVFALMMTMLGLVGFKRKEDKY